MTARRDLIRDINRGRDSMLTILDAMPGHLEQQEQAVIDGIRGSDAALTWLRAEAARAPSLSEAQTNAIGDDAKDTHESAIRLHRDASLNFARLLCELAAGYRRDAGEMAAMCADFGDAYYGQKALEYAETADKWEEDAEEIRQLHG